MAIEYMLQQDISKAKLEQKKITLKIAKEKNKNKLKKLQYRLDGIEDYIYCKEHPEDFWFIYINSFLTFEIFGLIFFYEHLCVRVCSF